MRTLAPRKVSVLSRTVVKPWNHVVVISADGVASISAAAAATAELASLSKMTEICSRTLPHMTRTCTSSALANFCNVISRRLLR